MRDNSPPDATRAREPERLLRGWRAAMRKLEGVEAALTRQARSRASSAISGGRRPSRACCIAAVTRCAKARWRRSGAFARQRLRRARGSASAACRALRASAPASRGRGELGESRLGFDARSAGSGASSGRARLRATYRAAPRGARRPRASSGGVEIEAAAIVAQRARRLAEPGSPAAELDERGDLGLNCRSRGAAAAARSRGRQ